MSNQYAQPQTKMSGFTLIECAIGMLIMTFLLSALIPPLTAQIEQRQFNDTQTSLTQISDALTGFAIARLYWVVGLGVWLMLLRICGEWL